MDQPADRPTRVKKNDRAGVWISIGAHIGAILIILIVLAKTKMGEEFIEKYIKGAREQKKQEDRPKPPPAPKSAGPRRAPIDAPPPSGGPRRAADAPAAVGESFFGGESAEKKTGPAAGADASKTNMVLKPIGPPPKPSPPPKLFSSAPSASTIKQLLAERAKAAASVEAIGSEQISRSGASDAGGAVTKIAGATVSDGKFAVIRGLNDRYISTTLNGANLPSADPYRQSAPLDLFPAQVIDRVMVAKTYTPDQPGNATGGSIDVFTKSFPERDFATISIGGEYNTQSSLNDEFLTYKGGGHDWAGMDDGTRALPGQINKLTPINPGGQPIPAPPFSSGVIGTPAYTKNVSNATVLEKVTKALGTTEFAPHHETSPINHNFSTAAGGSTYLLGGPLGYFASASYKHDYGFYEDGVSRRYWNGTQLKNNYNDTRALSVVNWSGMVNLAYQPFENHELGFTFFYNQNGTDDARVQDEGFEVQNPSATYRKFNLYYTERNLTTYQVKGTHFFPALADLRFDWGVALTQTTQDEPDARFFNDGSTGSGFSTDTGGIPPPNKPTRYFRELEENSQSYKLDWLLPFRNWKEDEGRLKFGLFDSEASRTFVERQFNYYKGLAPNPGYNNDPNQYLNETNLGVVSIRTNFLGGVPRSLTFTWGDYVQAYDSTYNGDRSIKAGYFMLDLPMAETLRLVGGVRLEDTDLKVHSESYLDSSITGNKTNDTHLKQSDLLPAAGVIWSMTPNMNMRVNYSETLARPSFRELAAYYSYDPIISDYIEGNPRLQMSSSKNYDFRWEWFPNAGELVSFSLFYKELKNAVERGSQDIGGEVITFKNYDATLYGVEFEGRKSLGFLDDALSLFSVGGNLSLVKSEVKLSPDDLTAKRLFFPNISDTRSLYDQAPYILNLDLNYGNPRSGTTATLIYNVAGPRITITKLNTEDVYEQPAPILDFIISQRIGRHTTIKFGAKNLINPKIERTYGKNSNLLYSSYTKGRAFGLSFIYDF